MKKRIELVMAVVLVLAAVIAAPRSARFVMNMKAETAPVRIAIDPGHGGADPGKVGVAGTKEKDINLQIAKKLQAYLEERGMETVLTREEDTDLADEGVSNAKVSDLQKRCHIIAEAEPLFAISIHQNSFTDSSASGPQVFYYEHSEEGRRLAEALQQSLTERLAPSNVRAAKANESYYMLKKTTVPTVIIECGFLSNPAEEGLLSAEDYQDRIVEAIYEGIENYLSVDDYNSRKYRS